MFQKVSKPRKFHKNSQKMCKIAFFEVTSLQRTISQKTHFCEFITRTPSKFKILFAESLIIATFEYPQMQNY